MATFKSRVKRLEQEWRFRCWLRDKRFLESLTEEQLEVLTVTGRLPPEVPEPPPGTSRLDKLDRKSLIKLREEDERAWTGRSYEELDFFTHHGHWPDLSTLRYAPNSSPSCQPTMPSAPAFYNRGRGPAD
jgi:hypothetical protein